MTHYESIISDAVRNRVSSISIVLGSQISFTRTIYIIHDKILFITETPEGTQY